MTEHTLFEKNLYILNSENVTQKNMCKYGVHNCLIFLLDSKYFTEEASKTFLIPLMLLELTELIKENS